MGAYQWKSGSRIKADPQASGELMERLSETAEGLTARTLLEANRAEGTPLHDDYEWVDEVAAENWRLQQSNHFLNCITTVIISATIFQLLLFLGGQNECQVEELPAEHQGFIEIFYTLATAGGCPAGGVCLQRRWLGNLP